MRINNEEINVAEAIAFADNEKLLLKRRKNNFLLSDYQIFILNKNGINYNNYSNINNLLFDIEEYLYNNYDNELDLVSSQIAELIYYKDTKK